MKKKIGIILAILLCVVLIFTFVACGNKDTTDGDGTTDQGGNGSGGNGSGGNGSGGNGGSTTAKLIVTDDNKTAVQAKIEAYIDSWLKINAQEEGNITNQQKSLKTDLLSDGQKDSFYLLSTTRKQVKYGDVRVTFDEDANTYDITVSYTDSKLEAPVVFTFKNKAAQTLKYAAWSGTKLEDDWVVEDKTAFQMIDPLIAAGVKLVNEVTGNAVTGKFGADGEVGLSIGGEKYGLRVKGNLDLTKKGTVVGKDEEQKDIVEYSYNNKASNEVGLVVVKDDVELFGLYYDAAATTEANKLYIMYTKKGDDGKLERDANNQVVRYYKYIDYVDILGYIEKLIPNTFAGANSGVLTFTDSTNAPIEINGLGSLLTAIKAPDGIDTIIETAVSLVAKAYKHDGNVYIDINLGAAVSKVKTLLNGLTLDFLEENNIEIGALSGLLGHITIGGKIDDTTGMLTGCEISVNIPKCDFKLNSYEDARKLVIPVPAISFSIYVDDFSFLKTGPVANVIPAAAKANAEYFSPANVNLSGNLYVKHDEKGMEEPYEATFHFDFATDINPFEIVANLDESTAKAALVIKRSVGEVYDEETADNFFSVSYEQASKTLTMSGIVFDLPEDDGSKVYTFNVSTPENMLKKLMLWLGMHEKDWHGLAIEDGMIVILDYQKAYTPAKFVAEKKYYTLVDGEYVLAVAGDDYVIGDDIPEDTYYVETKPYESAKLIFGDDMVKMIVSMIMYLRSGDKGGEETHEPEEEEISAADIDPAKIGAYFNTFKDFYNNYLKGQVIDFVVDPEFAFSAEVTPKVVNDVIDMINNTFKVTISHIGNDPEYVKAYINEIKTDEAGNKVGELTNIVYLTVKYDGKIYELTFDNSKERTFAIEFKLTLESGRTYNFSFEAVRSEDRETWYVETNFDIADNEGTVENSTTVRLSDFHGHWGEDYSDRVDALIPDQTDALPIFPAEDIPSVGTKLAELIIDLLHNETVMGIIAQVGSEFMAK